MPGQLRRRSVESAAWHSLHRRIQRLRDLDEAELRRHWLQVRGGVHCRRAVRVRAGVDDQRHLGGSEGGIGEARSGSGSHPRES